MRHAKMSFQIERKLLDLIWKSLHKKWKKKEGDKLQVVVVVSFLRQIHSQFIQALCNFSFSHLLSAYERVRQQQFPSLPFHMVFWGCLHSNFRWKMFYVDLDQQDTHQDTVSLEPNGTGNLSLCQFFLSKQYAAILGFKFFFENLH